MIFSGGQQLKWSTKQQLWNVADEQGVAGFEPPPPPLLVGRHQKGLLLQMLLLTLSL